MKKIASVMTVLLMALVPLALTSCDEDDEIAALLDGTWEGHMYIYDDHDHGENKRTRTEINFNNKEFHHARGKGYWIDHYSTARGWGHDYYACKFTFKVRDEKIYITFADGTKLEIRSYDINNSHFRGSIRTDNGWVDFSLYKTKYSYDDDYYWDDYYWYDSWYF